MVEHHRSGLVLTPMLECFVPARGFPADYEPLVGGLDDHANERAHVLFVVNDQGGNHPGCLLRVAPDLLSGGHQPDTMARWGHLPSPATEPKPGMRPLISIWGHRCLAPRAREK